MKQIALVLSALLALTSATSMASPVVYVRSNGQFVGNGSEYPRGFWVPAIQGADEVFAPNPAALEEYRAHLDTAKWFGILNWGALGLFLTYSTISLGNHNYNGGVALTVFLVPWIAGLFVGASSNRHLLKAMNLINGVPAKDARTDSLPSLLPTGLSRPGDVRVNLLSWNF